MIEISQYGTKKKNNQGSSGRSSGIYNSGQNTFIPVNLWGQYFDDTGDVDGDMKVNGRIEADEIETKVLKAKQTKLSGDLEVEGNITTKGRIEAAAGYINDLETKNLTAEMADLKSALIESLSAGNLVTNNLTVTQAAYFFELVIDKIKSAGGALLLTPADGFKIDKVVDGTNEKILYFRSTVGENEIHNMWQVGDQAISQNFNDAKVGKTYDVSNKFWWALVTRTNGDTPVEINLGTEEEPNVQLCHYIAVSTQTDEYIGNVNPEFGDSVVMLGHRDDNHPERQNAIYIAAYASIDDELVAPLFAQYRGINDFDLSRHKTTWFAAGLTAKGIANNRRENEITGNFRTTSGMSIEDYVKNLKSTIYKIIPNANPIKIYKDGSIWPSRLTAVILANNVEVDTLDKVPEGLKCEVKGYQGDNSHLISTILANNEINVETKDLKDYDYVSLLLKSTTTESIYDSCQITIDYDLTSEVVHGGHWEFAYYVGENPPDKIPDGTNVNNLPNGWTKEMRQNNYNLNEALWMSQAFVPGSGVWTNVTWSDPIRLTGENGEAGADGTKIEFIYCVTGGNINNTVVPSISYDTYNNKTRNDDDFLPKPSSGKWSWTDNPQGVTDYDEIEWVAVRYKINNNWEDFSAPAIWSKWGEKGMDGDGYEYIYKAGLSYGAHPKTIQQKATNSIGNTKADDDFVPNGWSDDPVPLTEEELYVWVSTRKKSNGSWSDFTDPVIWAHWSDKGANGDTWCFAYKKQAAPPTKPTKNQAPDSSWSINAMPNITDSELDEGKAIWMSQTLLKDGTDYGEWTNPIRVTGQNGKAGEDGTKLEFIYKRTDNETAPTKPSINDSGFQNDDYTGTGTNKWEDNAKNAEITPKYKWCWMCQREKGSDGKWKAFTDPVLWSRWGDNGADGDGIEYIYKLQDTPPSSHPKNITTPATNSIGKNKNEDDFVPNGWSDDPLNVSSKVGEKICWVSIRKKEKGEWKAFTDPVIWTRFAAQGSDGGQYVFLYATAKDKPNKPDNSFTIDSVTSTSTWQKTPKTTEQQIKDGYYTWMTTRYVSGAGVYDTAGWSAVVRITGDNGKDGEDGTKLEFIYKRTNIKTAPTKPSINESGFQNDDYTGTGTNKWEDNAKNAEITSEYKWCWMCQREKGSDGKWKAFTDPVLWSRFGDEGKDGDGIEFIFFRTKTKPSSLTIYTSDKDSNGRTKDDDEYLPKSYEGNTKVEWTDDPKGITEVYKYEWVSTRKKKDGTWSSFSTPALWSMYSETGGNGTNGTNGTNGLNAQTDQIFDIGSYAYVTMSTNNSGTITYKLDYKIMVNIYHNNGTDVFLVTSSTTPKINDYTLEWKYDNASSWSTVSRPSSGSTWQASAENQNYSFDTNSSYYRKAIYLRLKRDSKERAYLTIPVTMTPKVIQDVINNTIINAVSDSNTENLEKGLKQVQNDLSTLSQKADNINITVEKHTTTIDTLNGKIESHTTSISQIDQKADQIKLSVESGLSRSGINIDAGTITLNSLNTNIVGNMNLYDSNQGLSVWNSGKTKAAQIRTNELGLLNNYNFNGLKTFNGTKTGSKTGTEVGGYFEATIEHSLGYFTSGSKIDNLYCRFDLDEKGGRFITCGTNRTITKIEYTAKLINSSNVERKSFGTHTYNTPTAITRGLDVDGMTSYTTTASETLKLQLKLKIYTIGWACSPSAYTIYYNGSFNIDSASTNYICPDGIYFGIDKQQYLWCGNYKSTSSRSTNDWGFVVRNKQQNFAITPLGIFRTYYNYFSSDSDYNNIIGSSDYWGDIGSTLPVYTTSSSLNLNTTKNDGCRIIDKIGLITFGNSSAIDLTLPLPSTCPGKTLWLRARGGGQVRIKCSSQVIMDDDTNGTLTQLDMPGNKSCIMVSDGNYWIWFRTAHDWNGND